MTTINKQISLGADDCEEAGATFYLSHTAMNLGYPTSVYDGGFRWQSLNIAQSAMITSAKFSLYLTGGVGTLAANIRGIDEDNTATWSTGSRPSGRTKTSATITANEANWNNWAVDSWIDIDITSVIQEIVDRPGWSANNALAVVVEDTAGAGLHYVEVRAYEYAGNLHGAKLDIVFTEGRTTKNSRATMSVHPGVMFQTITGGHGY
jgi:hypothetical protein